jgi:hypothetical protein
MRRTGVIALFTLGLFLLAASPAMAEKRVAFVVGNARYDKLDVLKNPRRDAAVVADPEGPRF